MTGMKKQSGVALIISLVVLLLLTMITVTALQVTSLEQKMAGNMQEQNVAFQAAESALREAEGLIAIDDPTIDWDGDGTPDPNPFRPLRLSNGPFQNTSDPVCADGLCGTTSPLQSADIAAAYDAGYTRTATTGIDNELIDAEPEYIIELLFTEPSTDASRIYATFRVTALAWGGDPNSQVELQSTYRLHARSFAH
jgi:type IV pilus assembly protein PilX